MRSRSKTVYQDLADAIVLQAVEDYRNALKGISYNKYPPKTIKKEIERFFCSDYFEILTKVKGEFLIDALKKEHLENERRNNESNIDTGNTQSN